MAKKRRKSKKAECQILRIAGRPEQWLQEYLNQNLQENQGRVYGAFILLALKDETGGVSTKTWYSWESRSHLLGNLQVSANQIARDLEGIG
jgi:hypothetical protein